MTYKRFEDLPVWKEAIALAEKVYALTENPAFARQRSLQDQLERAAVSVSNNVAEGFERGTTQELLTFIYIARGSAGEVRSMLCLIERLPRFAHLKSNIPNVKALAESCARQAVAGVGCGSARIARTGQRRLNDATRERSEQRKRGDEFIKMLQTKYKKAEFRNPQKQS